MRYFWSLILALVLATLGLSAVRSSRSGAPAASGASAAPTQAPPVGRPSRADTPPAATEQQAAAVLASPPPQATAEPTPRVEPDAVAAEQTTEPVVQPEPKPTGTPEVAVAAITPDAPAPSTPPAIEPGPDAAPEVVATGAPETTETLDELLGVTTDEPDPAAVVETVTTEPEVVVAAVTPPASAPEQAASAPAAAEPAGPVGPAFEVRGDGSIVIEGVGAVAGAGTAQRPFVLDWQVLRSLAREFNPRQGQSEVPAWIMQLHGKRVRVEGNTLLPVVAQTTNELLVMQNPWDGCCLGVPPTPYDAIEVKLAQMQRMGNSPTGYGQVEGVFKVDPYIVSGWLLGLYVIDDAVFQSGAGITQPEI